jgi:hypothetical protein
MIQAYRLYTIRVMVAGTSGTKGFLDIRKIIVNKVAFKMEVKVYKELL